MTVRGTPNLNGHGIVFLGTTSCDAPPHWWLDLLSPLAIEGMRKRQEKVKPRLNGQKPDGHKKLSQVVADDERLGR